MPTNYIRRVLRRLCLRLVPLTVLAFSASAQVPGQTPVVPPAAVGARMRPPTDLRQRHGDDAVSQQRRARRLASLRKSHWQETGHGQQRPGQGQHFHRQAHPARRSHPHHRDEPGLEWLLARPFRGRHRRGYRDQQKPARGGRADRFRSGRSSFGRDGRELSLSPRLCRPTGVAAGFGTIPRRHRWPGADSCPAEILQPARDTERGCPAQAGQNGRADRCRARHRHEQVHQTRARRRAKGRRHAEGSS